ncbi:MAG: tetratricopeptide repeat protein, partial [Actinobacteria bacterium]|nr:tetratricopeptide repeat protein [Actinomycetota bacterium]
GAIAIVALGGGFLLIPRQDEYVAMLMRDGRYEEASRMLQSMRGAGDRRPQVLMQMLVLRIKQGDIEGAVEAVEAVLGVRPDDRRAQEILADLLLQSGRLDEYLRVTDRLVRSHPDPDRLSRLLALYRHHGRYDAELGLLQTFAGTRYLSLPNYERLGALLSARGDWQGAARWLRLVDREAPPAETTARLRLLHVLLQSGDVEEAQRLAEAWLIRWQSPYLAGKLIIRLVQAGAAPSAVVLARACAERMPETALQVAEVLTESAHPEIARELLARWIDLAREPSANAARDYVHASLAAGEWRRPLEKLVQLGRTGAPPEIQAGFAEEVAYGYGPGVLAQLMPLLPSSALRARPLLAAQIMRLGENRQLAEWYLDHVDPSRLAAHQQRVWFALLRELKPASLVLDRLIKLHESGRMAPELANVLADEAKGVDNQELHGAVWPGSGG